MDELDKMRKLEAAIAAKQPRAKKSVKPFNDGDIVYFKESSGYPDGTEGIYQSTRADGMYRINVEGVTRYEHPSSIKPKIKVKKPKPFRMGDEVYDALGKRVGVFQGWRNGNMYVGRDDGYKINMPADGFQHRPKSKG